MTRLKRPWLSQVTHLLAVVWLCLAAPCSLLETAERLGLVECCEDDCNDECDSCTQCVRCVTGHNVTVPVPQRLPSVALGSASAVVQLTNVDGTEHREPPFRPPVS